jgi:hypothetical protein
MNTRHNLHKTNPEGHEVVRATIPAAISQFLHNSLKLWTSLSQAPRGGETLKEKMKMEEVREMGAPSS